MSDENVRHVPFEAHAELLQVFLARRGEVVERIEALLNAQRKPLQYLQDHALLTRHFEDCFFTLEGIGGDRARLRGQLEEAHWASGFRPRPVPGLHNDLIHPAEMMRRGFYFWQQTRWPGRNGRVRYAHTLFDVYILRCLELLSMRLWDDGASGAGERLSRLQALLHALRSTAPPEQPPLLRDARWLVPLAQSPTTEELSAYFDVAQRVAEALPDEDRTEMQRAHVQMIGGHLRSQIRHYCLQDQVSIDERSVVLRTRTSNALDFALLIQNLVPLLAAYARARDDGDERRRAELATAIYQGISPDPDVFVNRIDLLGAYSMIEHLFITTERDGPADYSPGGRRHVRLLQEYEALIARLAEPLCEDCRQFAPVEGAYSPYGVFYGTPSNLTEHIALKTIHRDAVTRFSLEDVFSDGDADKVAWVNGWRQLPHIDPQVQKLHEYPHSFAKEIFDRIEQALQRRVAREGASEAARTGRLFIVAEGDSEAESAAAQVPELPASSIASSDMQVVAAQNADFVDQPKLLRDRQEGHFLISYRTSGGWVAVRKDVLTEELGAGRDVKIARLPRAAAETLRLMCRSLANPRSGSSNDQASAPPSMLNA